MDEEGLKEGLRSVAIIPVIHQDRVIACINVASHQIEEVPATARAALETLAAQVGSAIARVQAEEALRRAKDDLEIRVAERTAQLRQANVSLEAELRVRRDMEKSLRFSEAKYRTLVEHIPAITYIVSLTVGLDTLYISPQIEALLGFSPAEWRADDMEIWKRQIHPDDRERVVAEITDSLETGEPFSTEYRLLAKSGRVVWFRDEARVVSDPEGQFRVLQGLALDITERKQAEDALRETTHTLQTLIQASPLAIIALDQEFNIKLWNPGAESMFGWQESEMLGQRLPFVPEAQWPEVKARLVQEIAGEAESALEMQRFKKDGSPIDVELWTAPLKDAKGEVVGVMGMLADITERKQAEAGRARLAAILEATSDMVGTANREGRVLYINRAGRKMLEIGEDEDVTGLTVTDLQPEWADRFIREHDDVEAEGPQVWSGETTFRTRRGREIPTSQVIIVHKDAGGRVEFFSTIARDITASQQAAQALQEANNRLRTLVQASPLAIVGLDLEGRVISWNPAAERMFGWSQDEVMGRALPTIPKEEEEAFKALRQSNLQGIALLGQEVHRQRRDGSVIEVRLSTAPLYDGVGAVMGNMGIIEDITERKRLEATLGQASRALKAITECHQALIRATDELELLHEVCRIIVKVGGYRMAWAGYAEADARKSVRPVAQTGFDEGYVEKVNVTWADEERGRGPVGCGHPVGCTGGCPGHPHGPQFCPLARRRAPTQFSFRPGPAVDSLWSPVHLCDRAQCL